MEYRGRDDSPKFRVAESKKALRLPKKSAKVQITTSLINAGNLEQEIICINGTTWYWYNEKMVHDSYLGFYRGGWYVWDDDYGWLRSGLYIGTCRSFIGMTNPLFYLLGVFLINAGFCHMDIEGYWYLEYFDVGFLYYFVPNVRYAHYELDETEWVPYKTTNIEDLEDDEIEILMERHFGILQ